jgi:hypothetical protein
MLGLEEALVGQIVEKYVLGGPLINPKEEGGLSTNMQNLLGWYKMHIKKDLKHYIMADVREEHHFKRYLIHELEKSIITSYCL